jgi:DNA-binding transcriptional LysR family regulator
MELRHLRYFVTVAEELHFGRAAQRLNMSQPPLSRQIQELEEEVGFPLFVREYHKVELTAAGTVYLSQVKRVLEQLETAKQDAAAVALGRKGHLRIGHGTHLPDGYLSRVLAALQPSAPHVTIDLLEAPTPRVLQALQQKAIDVAFLITPSARAGLVVRALLREPLVIVVPAGHRYATAPLLDLAQLAEENFVLCRRYADPGYRELVEAVCREAGFTPRVLQAVEHKQTVLDLVSQGLGVSVVQASAVPEGATGVRVRQFPKSVPHVDTAIVWRDDTPLDLVLPLVEAAEQEALHLKRGRVIPMEAAALASGRP